MPPMSPLLRLKSLDTWRVLLFVIVVLAAIPRLLTYDFSLPYIDHPDEPSAYLKAQEWRGLYKLQGWDGYSPGIIATNVVVQVTVEAFGNHGIAPTVRVLRFMAVIANLFTLVFIALTARQIGGDLAGLLAGAAYGFSAVLVQNGVYATADPYVYLFVAAALWTATVALNDPHRQHWAVGSVGLGLLAMLFKYFDIVALVPGLFVALLIFVKDRRRGIRYLALQILLVLVVAFWLVFGYQVGRVAMQAGASEGVAMTQVRNPAAWLQFAVLLQNMIATVKPLNLSVFLVAVILGSLAMIAAAYKKTRRVRLSALWPTILMLVLIPEIASLLGDVEAGQRLRDVLPATAAASVILGVGFAQVVDLFPARWYRIALIVLVVPLAVTVFLPDIRECTALVQDLHREDWRVVMRQWADASLEPGWVIVDPANQRTFNPFFGGIPGSKTFFWWDSPEIVERPLNTWINQYKITYAAIPSHDLQKMQATQAGQDYLAPMLHLRDFDGDPQRRGPETVFYRLWRMETERHDQFGKEIFLVGYDGRVEQAAPGEVLTLRFYWQASARPPVNYSMYIHLYPMDSRTVLAQTDGLPTAPRRPPTTWDDPNETLIGAPLMLNLPPDLPPGQYRIVVGLYDYGTGQRLTTQAGNDYVELFTLNVGPAVEF